jgi:hypothetical protein
MVAGGGAPSRIKPRGPNMVAAHEIKVETEEELPQDWKYYLLKKQYPAWVYGVVLAIWAVILYFVWLRP